jgi:hypothetical protein
MTRAAASPAGDARHEAGDRAEHDAMSSAVGRVLVFLRSGGQARG